jgi:hypothetical protein
MKHAPRPRLLGVAVLAVVAACAPPPPASSSPSSRPSNAAPTTAAPAPTPTAEARIDLNDLPRVEVDPETLLAVCDPEPTQGVSGGPESHFSCEDVFRIALAAFAEVTRDPIMRIHARRAVCDEGQPCPPAVVESGSVTGWTATAAYTVAIDVRESSIPVPALDSAAVWPSANSATPEVFRPTLPPAPDELFDRAPYPFCGQTELRWPVEPRTCFLDAVLDGRPAETIDRSDGIEGDEVFQVIRFDGRGAPLLYAAVNGHWSVERAFVLLNPGGLDWSVNGWYGTRRELPLGTDKSGIGCVAGEPSGNSTTHYFNGTCYGWRIADHDTLVDAGLHDTGAQLDCDPRLYGDSIETSGPPADTHPTDLDIEFDALPDGARAQDLAKWACGRKAASVSKLLTFADSYGGGMITVDRYRTAAASLEAPVIDDSLAACEVRGRPAICFDRTGGGPEYPYGWSMVAIVEDGTFDPNAVMLRIWSEERGLAELMKVAENVIPL